MTRDGKGLQGGIVCSLVTPFDREGNPDLRALSSLIDFQIERGIHGLFFLGTAGEGVMLSADERKAVAEHAVATVDGRVPVAVHAGAPDTITARALTKHASDIGADAAAVVAPYYFAYGDSAIRRHFEAIASTADGVHVYLYENPERVGYSMPVTLVCDLVHDFPAIKGIKDTGDTIARVTQYMASGILMDVYTGNNLIVYPALVVGATGSVSATASAAPELFVAMYEAFREGRLAAARHLQMIATRLQSCLEGLPYIGGIKHLLEMRGLPGGFTREPMPGIGSWADELVRRVAQRGDVMRWMGKVAA